jgi:hypothetical protein
MKQRAIACSGSIGGVLFAAGYALAVVALARALIRRSAEDLAHDSALSVTTIRRAELMPNATALIRGQ